MADDLAACLWCGQSFAPRSTGGSGQRFCATACRHACHTAARRWAVDRLADGTLGLADIEDGPAAACAGSSVGSAGVGHGGIELRLYVPPERLLEMAALGWLDDIDAAAPRVAGAALAGLIMRALRLRLRPKRRDQNAT